MVSEGRGIKLLAATLSNKGVVEAIFLEVANDKKTSFNLDSWKKRLKREYPNIIFKEMTQNEVDKGMDSFEKWFLKEREKDQKIFEKDQKRILQQNKEEDSKEKNIEEEKEVKTRRKKRKAVKKIAKKVVSKK